ncbi:MAG: polyprenyl synthetase family protein [Planctomycetes bacterium]|nr:polyprenyl synthetase family protein [Planctomycetota bacterium]
MTHSTEAPSLAPLIASISGDLKRVNTWLDARYQPDHPRLAPLLEHLHGFRGKQVRAAQVFLVAQGCGGVREEHLVVAGVVEMIHTATLVHDDLLDGAAERRGIDCVHRRWNPHTSVLLGDWIYAQAFRQATELDNKLCSRELALATARICQGEIRQNLSAGKFDLSEQEYFDQIDGKTAALFEAAGRLGAAYAGASDDLQENCARHGLLAGRAFQMQDDLLDLIGDEDRARKSLGTDWANGKMTLPLIRLRDALSKEDRAILCEQFGAGAPRSILLEGRFAEPMAAALEVAHKEIADTLDAACIALEALPAADPRGQLIGLTRFLGSRTR